MLLARKIANAGDLLWGSLDSQERLVLGYLVAVIGSYLVAAAYRRRRASLIRELRDELETAAPSGRG